jgi:lysophospholipase L1-like esterase
MAELPAAGQTATETKWVTAWGTSQNGLGMTAISNATVRMIARVRLSGDAVRLRFDNSYGTSPVVIGKTLVGHRARGAMLAAGSNRPVTFNGSPGATLPAGGSIVSDPVPMRVIAGEDLAVSMYVPGVDIRPSQHGGALVTSYLSDNGAGDVAADEILPTPGLTTPARPSPFTNTTTSLFWLKAIDVRAPAEAGAIVALGDSITDGTCSTIDAHDRWVDGLAERLDLGGARLAVVNEGIGGNTLMREHLQPPPTSIPSIERLERDVLSHSGVTHVILFQGTNDIRREATAAQVIGAIQEIVTRVKSRRMKVVLATILPRHNAPPAGDNTGWSPAKSKIRSEVNGWIRTRAAVDGVLDFDRAMADPSNPDLNYPSFHCDGIHPNSRGYYQLAKSIPLGIFLGKPMTN